MKKIISSIAAAAIVMGGAAYAADFADMPQSHWAYSAVMQLVADGTVNGDESGNFNPDSQVTRAEMVKMVGKGNTEAAYGDVDESHWGYEYIKTSGVAADAEGNFRPSEAMTRGDVVELLWQRAGSPSGAQAPDSVKEQHKNAEAAAWGYETGVMAGYEDGSMMYDSGISRAEAAAVIVRSRAGSGEYASIKASDPDVFVNTYKNFGMFDEAVTYGAIAKSAALLGGIDDVSKIVPQGCAEGDVASMKDAADMLLKAAKRLNSSASAAAYSSVPLDGNADTERMGAVLYMIDKKAPLGVAVTGGKTENVNINSEAAPADENKFIYRIAGIPAEVYAAPTGKMSKQPYENYKFAMEFAGLFTTVTSKCEKIAKEAANVDAKITFYPSLSWNTGNSYKYRVKCEVVSVNGQTLKYSDVFGGKSEEILTDGMVFYADIESDYAFGMGVGALFDFSDPVYIAE